MPTRCSSSAAGSTRRRRTGTRSRQPGPAGRTSTSSPRRSRRPAVGRARGRVGRPLVPARRQRAIPERRRPRRRACGGARREQRRGPGGVGGRHRRRRRAVGRPGRPPWSDGRDAPPRPPGRGDRDDRRRQLRRLGRPRLPLPSTRDVPRPDVGCDGLWAAGRDHAALVHRDRPVVALVGDGGLAMTMAELETAVRESARSSSSSSTTSATARSACTRNGAEAGRGSATELGPIDFAAIARAVGAAARGSTRDDAFEPALRAALAAERPTVIQLALDRRWVSVDRRRRSDAADVPHRPGRGLGRSTDPAAPYEAPRSRPRASSTAPTATAELVATANRHYARDPGPSSP